MYNLDAIAHKGVDIVCNIIRENIPIKDKFFDEVWMFHMIEHITKTTRPCVLLEINRVLVSGGRVIFSYPEFSKCVTNYLENKNGQRDFWAATLYGRQSHQFDYHVVPMHSELFKHELIDYGFRDIELMEESESEPFNTVIYGTKFEDIITKEQVIAEECCQL